MSSVQCGSSRILGEGRKVSGGRAFSLRDLDFETLCCSLCGCSRSRRWMKWERPSMLGLTWRPVQFPCCISRERTSERGHFKLLVVGGERTGRKKKSSIWIRLVTNPLQNIIRILYKIRRTGKRTCLADSLLTDLQPPTNEYFTQLARNHLKPCGTQITPPATAACATASPVCPGRAPPPAVARPAARAGLEF
jgi:hypothetical protein